VPLKIIKIDGGSIKLWYTVFGQKTSYTMYDLNRITCSWFSICLWKNHKISFGNIVWKQRGHPQRGR